MKSVTLTQDSLRQFREHLIREEKGEATIEKYLRDTAAFSGFAGGRALSKELVIDYKHHLVSRGYAVRSVNSMLASVNSLLNFLGLGECRAKSMRMQRQTYRPEEKELGKDEYLRLLQAARGDQRLTLVMQTICGTGIRVSELRWFTLEAVRQGEINVNCKGKIRTILLPKALAEKLLRYAAQRKITSGPIFLGRTGKPLDRCVIWAEMKRLCAAAGVEPGKVFPHNLRKLFARTFYAVEKDIGALADILGHSSINTTRIYIMSTGREHRKRMERLGLVI